MRRGLCTALLISLWSLEITYILFVGYYVCDIWLFLCCFISWLFPRQGFFCIMCARIFWSDKSSGWSVCQSSLLWWANFDSSLNFSILHHQPTIINQPPNITNHPPTIINQQQKIMDQIIWEFFQFGAPLPSFVRGLFSTLRLFCCARTSAVKVTPLLLNLL